MLITQKYLFDSEREKEEYPEHAGWFNFLVASDTGYVQYYYLGKFVGKKLTPDKYHHTEKKAYKFRYKHDPRKMMWPVKDLSRWVFGNYDKPTKKEIQIAHKLGLFHQVIKDVFKAPRKFAKIL